MQIGEGAPEQRRPGYQCQREYDLHDDKHLAETIAGEAKEAMRAGIAAAEALPEPDPDLVTKDAYVE